LISVDRETSRASAFVLPARGVSHSNMSSSRDALISVRFGSMLLDNR